MKPARDQISDSVKIYLDEVNRIPQLSRQEEIDLSKQIREGRQKIKKIEKKFKIPVERIVGSFKRYKRGQIKKEDLPPTLAPLEKEEIEEIVKEIEKLQEKIEAARQRLIEANLKLVVNVAKKYAHYGVPFLDLIDEGNLGLMQAIDRFDYRLNCRFSTYAIWWIKQAILRAQASQGRLIRIPVYKVESLYQYLKATRLLTQRLGREPSQEEIAQELKLPLHKVEEMASIVNEPVSLETVAGQEKDSPYLEDSVFLEALRKEIAELLTKLKPKEQKVLSLRYGFDGSSPHTLEETGRLLGITRERVRQIEEDALNKLRHLKLTEELHDFLVE